MPKLGLLQPLSLVSISFRDDERKTMHTARSIEREAVLRTIPFDSLKTCIALFVSEVIGRSIGEEEENEELFKFLQSAILLLDDNENPLNFHLKFMIEFTRFLGFYPQESASGAAYFDLSGGEFVSMEPIHPYVIKEQLTRSFLGLIRVGMSTFDSVKITNSQRRELLQKLIDYYRLHLDGMKEINSHKVLEEILS